MAKKPKTSNEIWSRWRKKEGETQQQFITGTASEKHGNAEEKFSKSRIVLLRFKCCFLDTTYLALFLFVNTLQISIILVVRNAEIKNQI